MACVESASRVDGQQLKEQRCGREGNGRECRRILGTRCARRGGEGRGIEGLREMERAEERSRQEQALLNFALM